MKMILASLMVMYSLSAFASGPEYLGDPYGKGQVDTNNSYGNEDREAGKRPAWNQTDSSTAVPYNSGSAGNNQNLNVSCIPSSGGSGGGGPGAISEGAPSC